MFQASSALATIGTAFGVGFLCLNQTPSIKEYKTYFHQLVHKYSHSSGFGTSGIPINRGSQKYYVRGFICADCGHVNADKIQDKCVSWLSSGYLDRISSECWMEDAEWCELLRKNRK